MRTEYFLDTQTDFPDHPAEVEWVVYDPFGDLTRIANNDVSYTYTYTARHELASKTDSRLGKTLAWTYDKVGSVATKTDYQGEATEFQYDSTNRLVAEKNSAYLQVSYHYDGAGRLLNRILSNGAQTDYRYDADNRLTGLKNQSADGTAVEDLSYSRDRVGNITSITDAASGKTTAYTYDARYRLTGVDSSTDSEDRAYTYDAVGNRQTETANGTTWYYCYHATDCSQGPSGNRLINIRTGGLTGPLYRQFTYDDAGRITQKQTGTGSPIYSVSYNGKGRASQISGTQTNTFAYDPNDYRIQKDSTLYHLEGEHLEATYSSTGTLQNKYLRGVVVDEIVNGFTYHSSDPNDWTNYTFHHDQLNSVTALTGHNGTTEETTRFDAFGAPLSLTIPGTGNDLLYTGREYDRGTGLYHYRARYYDPEIGRFTTEDSLRFTAGGTNFYTYCGNNPINCNDPSGHIINFLIGAGANVAIGGAIRGLTGGDIFDPGAIAADAAIGVATSGLGALAQIRNASRMVNAARVDGRVIGNAQSTGTFLHAAASEQQAVKLLNQGAETVYFDRALSTVTGAKGFSPNVRPDVSAVFGNGSTHVTEVASKTQTFTQMSDKVDNILGQLDYFGFSGSGNVVGSFSTGSLPFTIAGNRTLGIANLGMDAVGAGVTFGGQALYQGANNFGAIQNSFAGGGFVLYPSKPNTNMMQSVYAK